MWSSRWRDDPGAGHSGARGARRRRGLHPRLADAADHRLHPRRRHALARGDGSAKRAVLDRQTVSCWRSCQTIACLAWPRRDRGDPRRCARSTASHPSPPRRRRPRLRRVLRLLRSSSRSSRSARPTPSGPARHGRDRRDRHRRDGRARDRVGHRLDRPHHRGGDRSEPRRGGSLSPRPSSAGRSCSTPAIARDPPRRRAEADARRGRRRGRPLEGRLLYHFGTKRALVDGLVERWLDDFDAGSTPTATSLTEYVALRPRAEPPDVAARSSGCSRR